MQPSEKPLIFIISPYYLPGYQSGALRTLANLVDRFSDKFDFRILTDNHDVNDLIPYNSVKSDEWNMLENAEVFYMSSKTRNWRELKKIFESLNPDIVYLNSFFFPTVIQYLTLRRCGIINKKPTIITPKGELSAGALKVKSAKKQIFLKWAKITGIYRDLIWQASVSEEEKEINSFNAQSEVFVVNDIPTRDYKFQPEHYIKKKEQGSAKFIFVSRIDPKKNVKKAIELLAKVKGDVEFEIYGPVPFSEYWRECVNIINHLPPNVKVEYKGILDFENVIERISQAHFFLLPTLGENFGHVILESLSAGTPVIISNNTPWLGLEKQNIGFDLNLENEEEWVKVLEKTC
jgi:glycosyltransferase involved in cell wall biosynthesis